MADITTARVSVHDLTGDDLARFIAEHTTRFGFPPLAGGAPEGEGDGEGDGGGSGSGDDDKAPQGAKGDGSGDGDQEGDGDDVDWKKQSRKHEREKKQAIKDRDARDAELAELRKANQSDSEKAIAKAKDEATAEVTSKYEKERRADRLEVAVTRAASKSFLDTDDALTLVQRGIDRGDIDADDIFDDKGKVKTDALKTALEDILEAKPHLAAKAAAGSEDDKSKDKKTRTQGGSGAGKGSGGGRDLESMSPADHFNDIRRHK